eukprot:12519579-Alexandrium_andersonii.AAC.1
MCTVGVARPLDPRSADVRGELAGHAASTGRQGRRALRWLVSPLPAEGPRPVPRLPLDDTFVCRQCKGALERAWGSLEQIER